VFSGMSCTDARRLPAPGVLPLLQGEHTQHAWSLCNTRNTCIGARREAPRHGRTIGGHFPRDGRAWMFGTMDASADPAER
jgi:hypothetical protein